MSHMRNEGSGLIESVAEVIRIAEEAGIPAQINHHKAVGAGQHPRHATPGLPGNR